MNNLQRVQNIFISSGGSLPANDTPIASGISLGQIGIYGPDMQALNPAGGDTITTAPYIYVMEGKQDSDGVSYVKKSMKISGTAITSYQAETYKAAQRQVWSIGYSRKTSSGLIEVNNDVNYNFTIRFKNDKWLYSERPELLNINFQSSSTATQLSIATQIASSINNSAYKKQVIAVVVGDGSLAYGLSGASNYGVEITAKDVDQFFNSTYTPNKVYFSVQVNDATGFGTSTTCTEIQAFDPGVGTYDQTFMLENKCFGYEGVANRRQWPIPVLDYSTTSTLYNSTLLGVVCTGVAGEDQVTFATSIAGIVLPGDKVELNGTNYEVKYIKGTGTGVTSANAVVLTSVIIPGGGFSSLDVAKVRTKYTVVSIEFNDAINTPTGVVAVANKSVIIAFPALKTDGTSAIIGGLSLAGTNVKAILDAWMTSTPLSPANITVVR